MYLGRYASSVESYKAMNIVIDEDSSAGTGALWLGDYTAASDRNTLKLRGVKTVLTVAAGLNISYPSTMGINHRVFQILDVESANITRIFGETHQMILDGLKRGGVLVHCAAGVSRSASTVIAFLMKSRGWTFTDSFNYVKKKRYVICPNYGFQRQLKLFEKSCGSTPQAQMQMNQTATLSMKSALFPQKKANEEESKITESVNHKLFSSTKRDVEQMAVTATSAFRKEIPKPTLSTPKTPDRQTLPTFKNKLIPSMVSTYAHSYGSYNNPQIVTYNSRNNQTETRKNQLYPSIYNKSQKY